MKVTGLGAMIVGLTLMLTGPIAAAYDPNKIQGGIGYAELYQAPTPVTGGYEYIVDFYTNGGGSQDYALWGFENDDIANKWFKYGKEVPRHMWTWRAAYGQEPPALPPSFGGLYSYTPDGGTDVFTGTDEWTLSTADWAMLNVWHLPSEYAGSFGLYNGLFDDPGDPYYAEAGGPYWIPAYSSAEHNVVSDMVDMGETYNAVEGDPGFGTASEDMLYIENGSGWWGHGGGLLWTIRIVVPDLLVAGDMTWSMPSYGAPPGGEDGDNDHVNGGVYDVLWATATSTPGDFDGDGDVDTNDIDLLCANLGDAAYDLDGDGDADEDDFVYLIETLVELTDGSGRTGTQVGDFNLDGLINATDLAIMNPNFGLGGMLYQNGNANCDDLINATDLAILAANFGYVAPAGAVPEPITMSLLALGAGGVLANRRRQ
ncbi:MAG: PEP-CTERM sorting domain-containing protein [Planctomycetota bacterium]